MEKLYNNKAKDTCLNAEKFEFLPWFKRETDLYGKEWHKQDDIVESIFVQHDCLYSRNTEYRNDLLNYLTNTWSYYNERSGRQAKRPCGPVRYCAKHELINCSRCKQRKLTFNCKWKCNKNVENYHFWDAAHGYLPVAFHRDVAMNFRKSLM